MNAIVDTSYDIICLSHTLFNDDNLDKISCPHQTLELSLSSRFAWFISSHALFSKILSARSSILIFPFLSIRKGIIEFKLSIDRSAS